MFFSSALAVLASASVVLSAPGAIVPASSEDTTLLPVTYSVHFDQAANHYSLMYMHYKYKTTYYGDAAPVLAALPSGCTMDPIAQINRFFCPANTASLQGKEFIYMECNSQKCIPSSSQ